MTNLIPSLALMVWLCGLHSEDVCAIADAIPNRLFYQVSNTQTFKKVAIPNLLFSQCPLMGDFFTYAVDAELYLGLVWLISYLWINQHIWYPKVNICLVLQKFQPHHCRVLVWRLLSKYLAPLGTTDSSSTRWTNRWTQQCLILLPRVS